jgi:hypothetical protein
LKIEEIVPLTNGLSIPCGGYTMVCDRAQVIPRTGDAVDVKFLIAGTDCVPRIRLRREQIARATSNDVARILRHVARNAVGGAPHFHS